MSDAHEFGGPAYCSRLIEMMSSRIVHDLIGSINAMANGTELLSDSDVESEVVDVLRTCSLKASAQAGFFRFAYGRAGMQPFSIGELTEIFASAYDAPHIELGCFSDERTTMPEGWGKVALITLQLLYRACAKGGKVTFQFHQDDKETVCEFEAESSSIIEISDLTGILDKNLQPAYDRLDPHNAPVCYLKMLLTEMGWYCEVDSYPESLSLIIGDNALSN